MENVKKEERSFIVTFEGLDFTGKTTQAEMLREKIEECGLKVLLSSEPFEDDPLIEYLKNLGHRGIEDTTDAYYAAMMFQADRIMHWKYLKNYAEKGYIIILDRYISSTIAYQSINCNVNLSYEAFLQELAGVFREKVSYFKPDIEFYLHKPEEEIHRIHRNRIIHNNYMSLYKYGKVNINVNIREWKPDEECGDKERIAEEIFDEVKKSYYQKFGRHIREGGGE